jgi:hypothetical protein
MTGGSTDSMAQDASQISYSDSSSDEEDEDEDDGGGPAWDRNVLTEGEYYLAMSMLVYVYSLLRETSMLGHTDIGFDEIDVNSFQSDWGFCGASVASGSASPSGGGPGGMSGRKLLSKTKSAGFIIRVVMDELEKKGAFSSVEKNEADMGVLKEFKKWVHDSRSKHLDPSSEHTFKELRRKLARRRWKRAIHMVRLMVRLGHSRSNSFEVQHPERRGPTRRASILGSLRDSMTTSMENVRNALRDGSLVGNLSAGGLSSMYSQNSLDNNHNGHPAGNREINAIINDALEEPRFFIEGSLLSNLIESGIEVVWFGDRHPNDVVYSICVNRQDKRVSVVFRGTVNSHNWLMNMKFSMSEHPNPIAEDYPGRDDLLGLHTGFSLYMMRQRKDDSLTKIEEIFANIDNIGRELAPDGDYQLSITGHSLGGALATILSFYAASSNMFSKVKCVRCFTFAAPRVGCQRFLHAYQHLEKIGKLRTARFTNTCDIVPLIPFHGLSASYKHVGMHVRLIGTNKYAQYWLRQALDVSYPKNHGFWSQLYRGALSSFIRNVNTFEGYGRCHTLSEHQDRIRFALDYRSILAQTGAFTGSKKSRLKTLDEYYYIKGASNLTVTGELTRIALEDRAKEGIRREARKLLLIIALIALVEGMVLVTFLKNEVSCDRYPTLLYPVYLLTGCRNEEKTECAAAAERETSPPISMEPSWMTELSDIPPVSNNSTDAPVSEETTGTNNSTIAPVPEEITVSQDLSWIDWLWGAPQSDQIISKPPCVWGHCNMRSRPHLPWGTKTPHQNVPKAIRDSSSSTVCPEHMGLLWRDEMALHRAVADMVLARSRTAALLN